ncbi:MAG: 4-hydroxythreonine-4-phosphate dehydrogenase PdxA [Nitrospirae bacterium]|nr:MAG: 4-hydroxythreonine-4-phosphate dehydrogenase PdxA [Nitrospirota bacterium]
MKKIAITMGDPAGVGPEIIVRALAMQETYACCRPIVIASRPVLEEALSLLGSHLTLKSIESPNEADPSLSSINFIETGGPAGFQKRQATAEGGLASIRAIRKAVELAQAGEVDAIVTAPISKEALKHAGMKWPGHTEMLAELTGTQEYAMMLVGGPLRVILVTIHTSIKSVPGLITRGNVLRTLRLAAKAAAMLGIMEPRIAVAGLNPHAGEAGLFGDEEAVAIIPAMEDARNEGIPCTGPYPPDTVFQKAYKGNIDLIVCMYHDQGLIPLKMIAFDKGVNVTVGLPIIRTSPDHGTAYDIAWKGVADPSSMMEAIRLAAGLRL